MIIEVDSIPNATYWQHDYIYMLFIKLNITQKRILYKSSASAEMSNRLATTDMARKVGDCCVRPVPWGNWVPI